MKVEANFIPNGIAGNTSKQATLFAIDALLKKRIDTNRIKYKNEAAPSTRFLFKFFIIGSSFIFSLFVICLYINYNIRGIPCQQKR